MYLRQIVPFWSLGVLILMTGCGILIPESSEPVTQPTPEPQPTPPIVAEPTKQGPRPDPGLSRQVSRHHVAKLKNDAVRLREDLARAEQALAATDTSVGYTSADAISALAEARVQTQGATNEIPWKREQIEQARAKLDTAKAHIDARNFSAAMYFIYRAQRITEEVKKEAQLVRANRGTLFVKAKRLNMRLGPSKQYDVITVLIEGAPVFPQNADKDWRLVRTANGFLGWVYGPMLSSKRQSSEN